VIDLIGKPYRYGADGTDPDGAIDCIHLVYTVLGRLEISTPAFKTDWYACGWRQISRDLLSWGKRIDIPSYDGDVLIIPQTAAAFAVAWSQGCLYINQDFKAVAWCPIGNLPYSHCFRTKSA